MPSPNPLDVLTRESLESQINALKYRRGLAQIDAEKGSMQDEAESQCFVHGLNCCLPLLESALKRITQDEERIERLERIEKAARQIMKLGHISPPERWVELQDALASNLDKKDAV